MGAYRAELLKLRRRPATWILLGVAALLVLVFSYLLLYLFVVVIGSATGDAVDVGFLGELLPEDLASAYVSQAAAQVGPVALILGVLAAGSEYGWRTVRLMVTQRPRRVPLLLGKLAAVATMTVLIAVVACLSATVASVLIAVIEGQPLAFPPAVDLLAGLGAAVLVLLTWSAFGVMLGVLCKGTGLPIGIGLVWGLVVEGALSLPLSQLEDVQRFLLTTNSGALASALSDGGGMVEELTTLFGGGGATIGPLQAVLVLAAYTVAFSAVATAVFARREIT